MTKTLKLSLVAAVAVAGISSANAKDLSEAIKGVDVSGTIAYRYNDYEDQAQGKTTEADSDSATNNYKIAINVSSPVNDDVTANTRFIVGSDTDAASLGTSNDGDQNVGVELSEVNFAYTGVQNLSVTVGKQGIATPWTIDRDAMGNESTGTGAVAAYTAGPVTLVGAYFNQTNLDATVNGEHGAGTVSDGFGANDIYVVGAAASFAGVNLDAFYADMEDEFDSYTVGLSASYDVAGVALSPFARYSSLTADKDGELDGKIGSDDQDLWQVGMGASVGMFNAFLAYGEAGSDGGMVYLDSGSSVNMDYHWRVTADGSADTEYLYAHVDADITDKINVGLFYSEADYTANSDTDEVYVQAKYKMSSNFTTYVRLGDLNVDNSDEDGAMGRLHVQYSF